MSAPNSPKSAPNDPKSAPRTQNVLLVVAALVIVILVVLLVRLMLSQPKSPQPTEPPQATEQPKSKKPATLTGKWEVVSDVGHSAFEYIVGPSKVGDELEFMTDGTLRMQSEALSYSIPEKNRLKIDVGMGYSGVYDYQIIDGQLTLKDGSEVFTLKPYEGVAPTSANLAGAWSMADISKVYMPGQPCLGFGSYGIDEASLLEFGADGRLQAMTKDGPVAGTFLMTGTTLKASIPEGKRKECRVKLTRSLLRVYNENGGADDFRAFAKAPEGAFAAAMPTPTSSPALISGTWESATDCSIACGTARGERMEIDTDGRINYLDQDNYDPGLRCTSILSLIENNQVTIRDRRLDDTVYGWKRDNGTLVFSYTDDSGRPPCEFVHPSTLQPSRDTIQGKWSARQRDPAYHAYRYLRLALEADGTARVGGTGFDWGPDSGDQTGTYQVEGNLLKILLVAPIHLKSDATARELTFVIRELTRNRLVLEGDTLSRLLLPNALTEDIKMASVTALRQGQ